MSHYKHLTPSEREKIYLLHAQNYSLSFIANSIGRNKSTVSRELTRNSNKDRYSPSAAQAAYARRRKQCKPQLKLSDPALYEYVRDRFLKHQWSPEQIAGRLSLENTDQSVSYATIYRAIYAGIFDTKEQRASHGNRGAIRQLRHQGKTRQTKDHLEKRGKIPISHAIADRPAEANKRCRLGDWEADTVIGKKAGPCLLTLTDRKSRFLLSRKAEKKASVEVRDAMIQCLTGQPCFSITPDKGKEFARHGEVSEALNQVPFYFPLPHHPWQRGTNENTNGLLREYFPKGFDLRKVTDTSIQKKWMN